MKSPENKLRHFADLDDLFDNCEDAIILHWVNQLAELKEKQRAWSKRHQERRKAFVRIAERSLDPDELALIRQTAGERSRREREGER